VELRDPVQDLARLHPVADLSLKGGIGTVRIDTDDVPVDADTVFPVVSVPTANLTLAFDAYESNATTM